MTVSSQPPRPVWIQRETAFPTASPAQPRCCWPRGMFTPRSSARWPISPCRGALLSMGLPTCLRLSKVDAPHVSSSPHLPPRPRLAPPHLFFCSGPWVAWNLLPDIPAQHQASSWAIHSPLWTPVPNTMLNSFIYFINGFSNYWAPTISHGEGNGNPLQCSCLESPIDRSVSDCSPRGCRESDTTGSLGNTISQALMCLGISFILLQLLCSYCMIGADLADCKHYNPNRSSPFLSTYCVPCTVLSDFIPTQRDPQCLSTCCLPASDLGAVTCPILSELLPCDLSVLPTLELTQHPMGNQVNVITCQVNKFYPRDLQLTWLENGIIFWTEVTLTLIENKDGTFNWMSWFLVNPSAHGEAVVLTCQVEHDRQPAVTIPWRSLLIRRTRAPTNSLVRTPLQLTHSLFVFI